jgi:hypothetical protein
LSARAPDEFDHRDFPVTMLEFDERQLKIDLASVPQEARVAFAAACAERLAPAYKGFAEISG